MRISYQSIADDQTAMVVNQVVALLTRADTLLLSLYSSPAFDDCSVSTFFSQLGRAPWSSLIVREGSTAGKASDPVVPQCSPELQGLAKQVQAISSKLGVIQAHLQTSTKTYAAAAAPANPLGPPPACPKPTHKICTCACLVLVPQIPLLAAFNTEETCQVVNATLADPSRGACHLSGPIPLPPVSAPAWLSSITRTSKGNLVLIGSPATTDTQLSDSLPYIKPILDHGFGIPVKSFSGMKWRHVCINGVPTQGPAFMSGTIAAELLTHNQWTTNLHQPIQPYWICLPSTIKPGHRSTVVLTFEDEDGKIQQEVICQKKAFLFG